MIQTEQNFLMNKSILFDVRLSPIDIRTYFALVALSNNNQKIEITANKVVRTIGSNKSSFSRSIKHLKKLKLLAVDRKHDGCIYHFLKPNN
jgi:predicted transcriptional regulator|tara:strand:- start:83 stop:355 length:273 start_codon:yes stop_codon:yes gene_type:complete